jgi:hypothetical protein
MVKILKDIKDLHPSVNLHFLVKNCQNTEGVFKSLISFKIFTILIQIK